MLNPLGGKNVSVVVMRYEATCFHVSCAKDQSDAIGFNRLARAFVNFFHPNAHIIRLLWAIPRPRYAPLTSQWVSIASLLCLRVHPTDGNNNKETHEPPSFVSPEHRAAPLGRLVPLHGDLLCLNRHCRGFTGAPVPCAPTTRGAREFQLGFGRK